MEAVSPPRLSGLARLLLRRPPSLRELVTLVGYADDYAWFAGPVRRLFPQEGEAVLSAPDTRERVEGFVRLFEERHFPLYGPFFDFHMEEGDEPPWTWLRRGIPYELMGFGCDGLHEMWDGYREGLSALVLLADSPDAHYMGTDGLRVAWLEIGLRPHPAADTAQNPSRGHIPRNPHLGSAGDRVRGAAHAASWARGETGNFFLDDCYEDGNYDGFADPWEDEIIREATEEWGRASALMDSVGELAGWLEEDLPGRFAQMLDFILRLLPNQEREKEENDDGG